MCVCLLFRRMLGKSCIEVNSLTLWEVVIRFCVANVNLTCRSRRVVLTMGCVRFSHFFYLPYLKI